MCGGMCHIFLVRWLSYVFIRERVYVCKYMWLCLYVKCIYIYVVVCVRECVYVCKYMWLCLYVNVCMCVNICGYVCT